MGKRRRHRDERDTSVSDVSSRTSSVSPGLESDNANGTSLPVGTQSVGFIVTNQDDATNLEEKKAVFMKDSNIKKSDILAGRLTPQDPLVMTVQQDLMMPTFNIYDAGRKDDMGRISPAFDRKPSLSGDDNLDKDLSETDRLTPPFSRASSRSGSGDFGDISASGCLIKNMSGYSSPAHSEGEITDGDEDRRSNIYDHSGTDSDRDRDRESDHTQEEAGEEEEGKEGEDEEDDEDRATPSKEENDTGFVLQFSLAKVLAHRAAEKMRGRMKKFARKRLDVPDLGLTSGLVEPSSEAALEIRLAHSEMENREEDANKPVAKKHWPKILVSLFPHGKQRWRKADYIPVDIVRGATPESENEEEGEGEDVQPRESVVGEEGTAVNTPEKSMTELQVESMSCVGSMRSDSHRSYLDSQLDVLDRRSQHRRYSVLTEEGVMRFDSHEGDAALSKRPRDESATFMNLVREFMEDTLMRSYQRDYVLGHGYTDITSEYKAHQQARHSQARERAIAAVKVKATPVQNEDIFASMTDEEMIARLIVRRIIRDSVALAKELDHQENMDAAAMAIAEEILAQLDGSMETESHENQHNFSICVESPMTQPLQQSEVQLRVEYPTDEESEVESRTMVIRSESGQRRRVSYVSNKGRTASSHARADIMKLHAWKPLPPIGSQTSTEDIGIMDPEASCESTTVLATMAARARLRGQMIDHSRHLYHKMEKLGLQLKKGKSRPVTAGICEEEARSLRCYDGVTRVMLSLATQTDQSWMETDTRRQAETDMPHTHTHMAPPPGITVSRETLRTTQGNHLSGAHSDTKVEVVSSKDRGLGIPHLQMPESSEDEGEDRKSPRPRKGMRPTEVGPPHIIKFTKERASPIRMPAVGATDEDKAADLADNAKGGGFTDKEKAAGHTDKTKGADITKGADMTKGAGSAAKTKGADMTKGTDMTKGAGFRDKTKGARLMDKAFVAYNNKYNWMEGGVFQGTCEFCQQDILPYPTDAERLKAKDPDKLFCCRDYEKFVGALIADVEPIQEDVIGHVMRRIDKRDVKGSPERIDIRSQQQKFYVNEEAKKQAAERMKERELQRQRKANEKGQKGHGMGANFHHGNQAGQMVSTMSFSLSLTLATAKVQTPGKSFPHPPPGSYRDKDGHSRRMDSHHRRMTTDGLEYSDYHRPSGHARGHHRGRRQTGDDPHFSEARRMMAGHHLGTATPSDYSYQSNAHLPLVTRKGREGGGGGGGRRHGRRSQELGQPMHSFYGFDRHDHGGDASYDRMHSGRRHSGDRGHSREKRYSRDRRPPGQSRRSKERRLSGESRRSKERRPSRESCRSKERRLSRQSQYSHDSRNATDKRHLGSGRQGGEKRQRGHYSDESYDSSDRHDDHVLRSGGQRTRDRRQSRESRLSKESRYARERRLSKESRYGPDSRYGTDKRQVGSARQIADKRQHGRYGNHSDADSAPRTPPNTRRNVQRRPVNMKLLLKNVTAPPWPSADAEHFEVREGRLQPKAHNYSEMADFEPEPVLPPWAVSEVCDGQTLDIDALRQTKTLVTKFYPHGKLFLVLFPDGTGSVFYPSGKLGITIASVTLGFYIYIVQDKQSNIMGVFDGHGHAYTNYRNSKLRLCLDQKGGLELDWRGGQKRKWQWRGQEEHVHAPPLQPITFAITNHAAVRLMAQDNITLTFNCWSRACRFQVGAKLRPTKHFVAHKAPLDEVALMRNETKTKIEAILDRVANLLKFPHCTTVDKMTLPLFLRATIERQEHMRAVMQATVKGLDIESSVFVH